MIITPSSSRYTQVKPEKMGNDDDLKSCLDNYVVWRVCCSLIVRFANRLKMVCGWRERNLLCICVRSREKCTLGGNENENS